MKCTTLDVREAHAALTKHGGLSLPAALSMRFARMTRAIRTEGETADEAVRALVDRHRIPDKDGKLTDQINNVPFQADLKVLHGSPAEIPGEPFKLSELGAGPIHSDILATLHFAIVDG